MKFKALERIRKWFLWISLAALLLSVFLGSILSATSEGFSAQAASNAALITSAVTFLGFILTTIIALRKEQRESSRAELELEKLRLENEKLRRDLEEMKAEPARRRVKRPS
jgi:uncharacterized membrane protein (DUF485 family)